MGDRMPSADVRDDCAMANAERTATTVWEGDLAHGNGNLSLDTSGAARDLPVTWASRTARSDGKTSPEELIAAAHSSCFSMALSNGLAEGGTTAERLDVSATVTLDTDTVTIVSSHITVRGVVPGLDADGFAQAALGAAEGCPVSGALKAALEITVDAQLVDA